MDRIELLAPAGDLERLKITLLYGADAVYLGGQNYSLRANATNFDFDELKEGCSFAHKLGKKVYQTVNIVFHNEDMDGVEEYLTKCVEAGVDAFIVSDPFIISYIKENFNVEAHLSTQNSTTNYKAVEYFKNEGIDRVVLARELSKNEIKEIIDKCKIDTEVFIHGAMCTCFSGRCALSNYVTNRDANRGGCAQVCRFAFRTNNEKDFTLATKDLNMARYIRDLIDIGVKSLKVEGRMRSIYYLATVLGTYRKIIDDYYNGDLTDEKLNEYDKTLSRVANRETTPQYFIHKADYTDQYYTGRCEVSNQDFLALINYYDNDKKLLNISEKNYFELGDEVEIFTPDGKIYNYTISKIYDEEMNSIDVARHPEEILYLPFDVEVPSYSMIRLIKKGSASNG